MKASAATIVRIKNPRQVTNIMNLAEEIPRTVDENNWPLVNQLREQFERPRKENDRLTISEKLESIAFHFNKIDLIGQLEVYRKIYPATTKAHLLQLLNFSEHHAGKITDAEARIIEKKFGLAPGSVAHRA
jgi:hypothetical protein